MNSELDMMWRLDCQRIIVTGGSKGIGKATVMMLLERGAYVCAIARDESQLRTIAQELPSQLHERYCFFACDISDESGRNALVAYIQNTWETIDGVVHNAGTNIRSSTLSLTDADADTVRSLNFDAVLFLTRSLIPLFSKEGGNIVVVTSVSAFVSTGTGVVYGATKAALQQAVRFWSVELASRNIRVNAVAPWYIQTPLTESILSDSIRYNAILQHTPMRRIGQPSEVASAICFLLMNAASYITGSVLPVDGGFLARGFTPPQ